MSAPDVDPANLGTADEWAALIRRAAGILGTDPEYWSVGCVTAALDWLENRVKEQES